MDFSRRSLIAASTLALGACTYAHPSLVDVEREPDLEIPLWSNPPGAVPEGLREYIEERRNRFNLRDRAARDVTRPLLAMFRAQHSNGSAVLVIPGGGYRWVVIDKEGYEYARWLNRRGVHAYVLRYRLPHQGWSASRWAPLQDAQRALRLIRARAETDGIDPERVMTIGFSAGGHLAATLAAQSRRVLSPRQDETDSYSATPNAVALIYPVVTMREPYAHAGSKERLLGVAPSEHDIASMSVEEQDLHDFAPTLIVHAQDDDAVPLENALLLHGALRRHGKSAALHLFESGGHGFGLRGLDALSVRVWPDLVHAWGGAHGIFPGA